MTAHVISALLAACDIGAAEAMTSLALDVQKQMFAVPSRLHLPSYG